MSDKRLVCGVGLYEKGKYISTVGRKITKEYHLWYNMLQRCYLEKNLNLRPTYRGCSVSEEFRDFQRFAEWCNTQIGFGVKGYHLDKDIIYKGNKQYNRDSCAFVPRQLNLVMVNQKASRGECPIGVSYHKVKGKYIANVMVMGKYKSVGHFSTPEEAFCAYKIAKEAYVKLLANEYKGSIDSRVYQALLDWTVEVED